MLRLTPVLFLSGLLLITSTTRGQQFDSNLTVSGAVDVFFARSLNGASDDHFTSFLYNHNRDNAFAVNLALVSLKYATGDVRASMALHAGTYQEDNYAGEPPAFKPIYEAYAGMLLHDHVWLDAGIFSSHLGAESPISKDNWTLTRSLYAENSPYFETGARVTFEPNQRWRFAGLVLNGWQNIKENNKSKAIGSQIQYKPNPYLTINSSSFYGNERSDSSPYYRLYHDLYVIYQATEYLGIQTVFDIGNEESANGLLSWYGLAGIMRFRLSDWSALAVRAEYFCDKHGVIVGTNTSQGLSLAGYSINLDLSVSQSALLRCEGKLFVAGDDVNAVTMKPSRVLPILTSSLSVAF